MLLVIQFVQNPPTETGTGTTPTYGVVIIALFGVAYFGLCIR